MDARDFVPMVLLAMNGEIHGKTKLQKTVFFLGLLTENLEDLGYRAHFYGPYSEAVADAVGWLKTIGAVEQSSASVGSIDESGFEIRRFDFRLNPQGRRFAEATAARHSDVEEKLRHAAALMTQTDDLDYVKLSIAAKTYFMLRETGWQAGESDLARLASRFGWEVTLDQVKEPVSYLCRLGLLPS